MALATKASRGPAEAPDRKQAISAHLRAMRTMVVVVAATVFICFAVIFYLLAPQLVGFILAPVYSRGISVIATKVSESLMMTMKTCLVAAVVAAMPMIIWQIWSFIGPALYPGEKKAFIALFFVFVLMFAAGVAFSYTAVFPLAIDLFYEASEGVAEPMWSVDGYFNFVLSFVLPFGLMFNLPVVIYILARRGKVTGVSLSKNRKYFILAAAVAAAVLTPPDVVSQLLLLAPLLLLYEISVVISRAVKPVSGNTGAEESA